MFTKDITFVWLRILLYIIYSTAACNIVRCLCAYVYTTTMYYTYYFSSILKRNFMSYCGHNEKYYYYNPWSKHNISLVVVFLLIVVAFNALTKGIMS